MTFQELNKAFHEINGRDLTAEETYNLIENNKTHVICFLSEVIQEIREENAELRRKIRQ